MKNLKTKVEQLREAVKKLKSPATRPALDIYEKEYQEFQVYMNQNMMYRYLLLATG